MVVVEMVMVLIGVIILVEVVLVTVMVLRFAFSLPCFQFLSFIYILLSTPGALCFFLISLFFLQFSFVAFFLCLASPSPSSSSSHYIRSCPPTSFATWSKPRQRACSPWKTLTSSPRRYESWEMYLHGCMRVDMHVDFVCMLRVLA